MTSEPRRILGLSPPKRRDNNGRCCGRKPMTYKRPPHLFCPRCDVAYDMAGTQIENWAWKRRDEEFGRVSWIP